MPDRDQTEQRPIEREEFRRRAASLLARFRSHTDADPEWTYLSPSYALVGLDEWSIGDGAAADVDACIRDLHRSAARRGIQRIVVEVVASDAPALAAFRAAGLRDSSVFAVASSAGTSSVRVQVDTVRTAGTEDRATIVALAREEALFQAVSTSAGTSVHQPVALFEALADDWLGDLGSTTVLVAETGLPTGRPEILGLMVVQDTESAASERGLGLPERHGYIAVASVTATARGRGTGSALFAAAEAWCVGRGLDAIALDYIVDNAAARPFWSARGFRPVVIRLAMRVG
ncbi:GNAT family N-acetyltransferase [Cryobacterium zhongshanensis]|uniref:GNAT family N-acetyltransferase n=1 Tax=Cryobacterium zhongshanensis TaxID=2928153 RepID=A0AA41QVJ8_9MICO|nr:GNAT family N-acetyltransferase [Cryobacterium zhongshanensis]MCI4657882.1 GNAT family N-acetyltransferase [Cryobacterium zhongshanensis]